MTTRRSAAFGLVGLVLGLSATAWGQIPGPYPKFRDGVVAPPAEAVTNAPFDVAKLFEAPPPGQNSERLYLEALAEVGGAEMASCYPESEREQRVLAARDRVARFNQVDTAWQNDPRSVPAERVDAVLAEYAEGFLKLVDAQTRGRCVFQTGVGPASLLPHTQSARHVARVATLKARRELDRGEIDAAIGDVAIVLQLARDLQPRGYIINQIVSAAMVVVTAKEIVGPILAAPGLTLGHCDRLAAVLADHEDHAVDAYTVSFEMEYVMLRVTLLGLVKKQDELVSAVGWLNAYSKAVLDLKGKPALEQIARFPDRVAYFGGDDLLRQVLGQVQFPIPNRDVIAAYARPAAVLRGTECLVALRRWQLTHDGKAPDALAPACRASGLKAVPADPYDGKPLRLAVVNGEPVVYAIGKDGRDDGGLVDSELERKTGDLVLRLPAPGPR